MLLQMITIRISQIKIVKDSNFAPCVYCPYKLASK